MLEKLRRGGAPSAKEKTIPAAGLVSVLQGMHDDPDLVILAAYGPAGYSYGPGDSGAVDDPENGMHIVAANYFQPLFNCTMSSSKPPLISIHGIRTYGAWQEWIGPIMRPHFRYLPVKYDQYRALGGLKLPMNELVPAVSAVVLGCAAVFLYFMVSWPVALVPLGIAAMVIVAWGSGSARINRTVDHFLQYGYDGIGPPGEPVNIIAHSLGTSIVFRALEEQPVVTLDRVVLAGSVLPRETPLAYHVRPASGKPRIRAIRNEFGERDLPARMAGMFRWFLKDMGDAGFAGFIGSRDVVHEVQGGTDLCPCGVPVHNVKTRFRHSSMMVTRVHAAHILLPWLLGYDKGNFQEFLGTCSKIGRDARSVPASGVPVDVLIRAYNLAKDVDWIRGDEGSLLQVAEKAFGPLTDSRNQLRAARALLMMCEEVGRAVDELEKKCPEEDQLTGLDPMKALKKALSVPPFRI
ncbi:MAG TPA: hypothetical protein VHI13_19045 [Candidatus Kapabacteria bacterium]|nr:hypothetical protein [Candidatus Kapabacteria bacterium]